MKRKPVVLRARADRDVQKAVEYYLQNSGKRVALGFIDAFERACLYIARHPASGMTRIAYELDMPALRCWLIRRYPYLVFYVESEDHIDVWRVLHGERDIPSWLNES